MGKASIHCTASFQILSWYSSHLMRPADVPMIPERTSVHTNRYGLRRQKDVTLANCVVLVPTGTPGAGHPRPMPSRARPVGLHTVPNRSRRSLDRVPVLCQDRGTSTVNYSRSFQPSQPSRGFRRGWETISDGHLPVPTGQKSERWVEELPSRLGALNNQPGGVEGRSRFKSSDTKHLFRLELVRSSGQNLIQPAIPRRSLRIGVAVKAYILLSSIKTTVTLGRGSEPLLVSTAT
ncbi:hypothetical protein QBC47DRAFT_375327 [Echria macrotheca]|uniref:Uncharacterized protein n=1 Tax=Echria macrotheca TaxID=438768 RepID=A0AAJ0FED7_9PEZI|nr:hypothetical protein QBC47DRAFT_375327 [Echria macrotheca]